MVLGDNDANSDLFCNESLFPSPSTSKYVSSRQSLGPLDPSLLRKRPLAMKTQRPRSSLPPPVDYVKKRETDEALSRRFNDDRRQSVKVEFDVGIHFKNSSRVLKSLMISQPNYSKKDMLDCQHYGFSDIVMFRKEVVTCMEGICKEEQADVCVFPLAVQFLDRFLCLQTIEVKEGKFDILKIVGLVCVVLASKIKAPLPITPKAIVAKHYNTPLNTFTKWESLVAQVLGFDLSTPTAFEFLDQLLSYGEINFSTVLEPIRELIINRINVFQKDLDLACLSPCDQMSVAVLTTIRKFPVNQFLEDVIYNNFAVNIDMVELQVNSLDYSDKYYQPPTKCRKPRIVHGKRKHVRRPPPAI